MFELTYQTGLYYQGLGEAGIDFYVQKKKEEYIRNQVLEIQELISLNKQANNKVVAFHPSLKFVFLGVDPSTEACCKSIGNPYANVQITFRCNESMINYCNLYLSISDQLLQLFSFCASFWSPQGKRKRFFFKKKGQKTRV